MSEFEPNAPIDLVNAEGRTEVVQEGESARLTAQLSDGEANVLGTSVNDLTFVVYDETTGTKIREVADALGDLDDAGLLTIKLLASDNVIIGEVVETQSQAHIVRVTWTWNDGEDERVGIQEVRFYVQKLRALIDAP